jgi:4-methyl-5(b-hydroxyethyl)-thiazole monophosphate biosynthesis
MPLVHALVVLADGFEEIEAITPIDILRRAGVKVTVSCIAPGIHATGRSGLTLHADGPLDDAMGTDFELIMLPGGPGVQALCGDRRVLEKLRAQYQQGRWIAAICAAPLVLDACGILTGARFTAHPSVASQLPRALFHERVVVDGKIITSRGAGTALDFGLKLVEVLDSSEKATSIFASICA